MIGWGNIVIQGVLIGGLYAMFAAGLALIFGVMRLVNIAHGDLIVLAAYLALIASDALAINPLAAIAVVAPVMAALGYVLQRGLLNRTLGDDLLPPLLVTFGLSVIIQNALQELFTADPQKLDAGAIEVASEVGTRMDPDNFSHSFARLCERAGLRHWHPHELRHSGASLMLAQGTPLHVVSEVLGHASIAITKDV